MSNPSTKDVYVKPLLSNFGSKIFNDQSRFVAPQAATLVPVVKETGYYHKFERLMRDQSRPLAENMEFAEGSWEVTQGTYSCKEYGLSMPVTENMQDNAEGLDPFEVTTEAIVEAMLIGQEKRFADIALAASSWGDNKIDGYASSDASRPWSDPDSDPLNDIDDLREMVLSSTSKDPNTLVLTRKAYRALKNHPVVIERHKYTSKDPIGPQALAALFEVEKVLVCNAVEDKAESGKTAAPDFIVSGSDYADALLCYVAPVAGLNTPTALSLFAFKGDGNVVEMRQWDEPGRRRAMLAGKMHTEIAVVAPALGAVATGMFDSY